MPGWGWFHFDLSGYGRASGPLPYSVHDKDSSGHADHLDQLRRAALSLTLNTAEGSGEFAPKEKARFYRMARRSGVEAAAVLDSFIDRGILMEHDTEPARAVLHRAIGALTRLVQSVDPEWTQARRRATPPRDP